MRPCPWLFLEAFDFTAHLSSKRPPSTDVSTFCRTRQVLLCVARRITSILPASQHVNMTNAPPPRRHGPPSRSLQEEDVFTALGLEWREPKDREGVQVEAYASCGAEGAVELSGRVVPVTPAQQEQYDGLQEQWLPTVEVRRSLPRPVFRHTSVLVAGNSRSGTGKRRSIMRRQVMRRQTWVAILSRVLARSTRWKLLLEE